MASDPLAVWFLEREARAMMTRLDRVKPFALQETMLPAAALSPAALLGIERFLVEGRRSLRRQIRAYLRWLRGPGQHASPDRQQRGFTVLRLRFNLALSQLDLFSDVVTQRSEHETGVWLAGLDVAAQDALRLNGGYLTPPPIVCHLHRGMGGAIRRARTRLPGGGSNPVAIIRIPRERMIGFGIASSLVHEVGHQGAALLELVPSLRRAIAQAGSGASTSDAVAWRQWGLWISEIVADLWSIARVGVASTMGLMGLVSLPKAFVFRITPGDPHPSPWVRVQLSCAIGNALYPDPQWDRIAAMWRRFYPLESAKPAEASITRSMLATMPAFVALLLGHRPKLLHGRSLGDALRLPDRHPQRLLAMYRAWQANPSTMRRTAPSLAFAITGQARAKGLLTPEREDRLLGRLIAFWALDSTMRDTARSVAAGGISVPEPTTYGATTAWTGPMSIDLVRTARVLPPAPVASAPRLRARPIAGRTARRPAASASHGRSRVR
jgi:hypothetical protein